MSKMGIYSFFEDKWYSAIEAIDNIVPVTKLTDKIDSRVPSFLIFLLIIFILFIGFIFFFAGNFWMGATYDAEITVVSKIGLPLSGTSVTLYGECGDDFEEFYAITDLEGKATFEVCSTMQNITLEKEGYKKYQNEIDIEVDKIFKLSPAPPQIKTITVLVKDKQENILSNAEVDMVCNGNITSFDHQTSSGFLIDVPTECSLTQLRAIAPGYKEQTKTLNDSEERIVMELEKKVLNGKIIFETKTPTVEEEQVEIRITDSKNKLFTEFTDNSGTKEATLETGEYTYSALSTKGEVVNGSFSIITNSTERETILFSDIVVVSKKALYVKVVSQTDDAIIGAKVSMYRDGNSLASRNTNALGETNPITVDPDTLPTGTTHTAIIKAPGYETKFVNLEIVEKSGDPQKITMKQGGATLKVIHIDDIFESVRNAFTTLYYKGLNEVFDSGTSDTNGEISFQNLPPGQYTLKSTYTKTDSYGEATTTLSQDETSEITITLITGEGKMKFNFMNQTGTDIDTNYEFYESIDGMLQKTITGETTRNYFYTDKIKSRTKVMIKTTNPNYFPHETITYKMSRATQNKDVFLRELNALPNSELVQMFLVGIYSSNPTTETFNSASKVNPGNTYYLYFDIVLNNENVDYLASNFKIGDGTYLAESISLENIYSIDGYSRVMTNNSNEFIIDITGNDIIDSNATQANLILAEAQGKKSIPVFVEIKVDENAIAEDIIPLYFQTRHGSEESLLYVTNLVIGESVCMFEYDSDCPAFLLSHYLKWNNNAFAPLENNHIVLIGDDYTIKTTVKNLTDEDIGTANLKLIVPKEKMNYYTIENDTNSTIHSLNLIPFETTSGKETELNLIKKTNSGKINLEIEKDEGGLNSLIDYTLNEDQISIKVVEKKELDIAIIPEEVHQNVNYPHFFIKTKYKSQYKGTPAIWYVEKNGVRLGSGYEGITDKNGEENTSFDATGFDEGDVLTFIAYDLGGNIPASLSVTVRNPFPPTPDIAASCLKLKLPGGSYANKVDIPHFEINVNDSTHIYIKSECVDTRKVYLYTDLYVSENSFDIAPNEEHDITVTGTIRNNIYGAYPLQLLEIGSSLYTLIEHIDVVVNSTTNFSLDDAILDFRNVDEVTTKVTNKNFAGRKDVYNPQANISTNSVNLVYNKPGIPEIVNIKATVVGSAVEAVVTGFGWAGQIGATKNGEGCSPSSIIDRPKKLEFTDDATTLCTNVTEGVATLEVTPRPEPEIDATNYSIPFYELPTEIQNQIISQIADQSGNSGNIIATTATVASEESERVEKLSFDGVTWRTTGWNSANYTAWTPGNLGHDPTTTQIDDMEFGFYNSAETPVMEGSQSCYDRIDSIAWVGATRPPNFKSGCKYTGDECWGGVPEQHVAKIKPITMGGHCNACAFGYLGLSADGTPEELVEELGDEEGEAGIYFLLGARGEKIPCGFLGLGRCNTTATITIQPEFYRILTWQTERNEIWTEDFNIVPIEGKVYTLGSYNANPIPEWTDLTVNSMFDISDGETWRSGENGTTLNTAVCVQGMGFIPPDKTSGETHFAYKDEADPWVEYSAGGYTMYELVDVPSNVRMFLKWGDVYAEYIGDTSVASNNIDMTFTNNSLQGNEYAVLEVQDWVGDEKEKMYFQVKLVGNEHNCFSSDGVEGVTGSDYVPKLLFNWDWNAVSYDQCDSTNYNYTYCDGVQFNISLFKRLNKIEQLLLQNDLDEIPEKTAFYAYLIKDNYSQELLDDFITHYSADFLNAETTFTKFKKFIENNKLNYEVILESGTGTLLSEGGLYRVEINITRDNENLYSLFNGNNINADITIVLKPINRAANYNPFYETPFDGDIGSQRIGYGASVDVNGLQLNNLTIADDKGSNALKQVSFETSTNLATLDDEIVLRYDGNSNVLQFYPSQPTPIEATIVGSTGTANVTYTVKGTQAENLPAKEWRLTNSTIGGAKCHDFEDNEVTFVNETTNGTTHALRWNGTKSGTLGLTTTMFSPRDSGGLEITPTLGALTFNSYSGLIGSTSIFLKNYNLRGITNYDTLEGIFEMIKDEKLCMTKQADTKIEIFWNPDYLDSLTQSIQTSSGSSC